MKYVLVSGGVISGVGKGIIASSTGLLLKTAGLRVSSIKVDPYLNVDAGTMNPKEHGEVFVLDDGGEVDLDLGNYERYLNITLTKDNNITTGKIYRHVIERERKGDYLGRTVQVVPHITDAIQDWIVRVARIPVDDTREEPDVCIIELGGTVGDIESMPFVEAITQLRRRAGKDNFLQIHVSYVPVINREQKTKPTQQAIRGARSAGLIPDLIACRCERPLDPSVIEKIAHFCFVGVDQVVVVPDTPSIYQVPILLEKQGLRKQLSDTLHFSDMSISSALRSKGSRTWIQWKELTIQEDSYYPVITIALVGKYVELHDSYASVIKSLEHAAMRCHLKINVAWVNSEHLEVETRDNDPVKFHKAWHDVCTSSGILVPGGFGHRGTEGMIEAAKWAREHKIPYLGICLGMQIAVIEFARSVCGIQTATSEEFIDDRKQVSTSCSKMADLADATAMRSTKEPIKEATVTVGRDPEPVIIFMPEIDKASMGGTMRLGLRPTVFQEGSLSWSKLHMLYGPSSTILERHRHRYEINPSYVPRLEECGLPFIGKDDQGLRMEIFELADHPWFIGVQFHPEYLSRVLEPSRPYLGFVAASGDCLERVSKDVEALRRDGRDEVGVERTEKF